MNDTQPIKMNTKFAGHHISSGGFIFHKNKATGEVLVLLVRNKKGEYWIPKGHIEKNEDQIDAAFREIEEETGLKKEQLKYIDLLHLYKFSFTDDNGNSNTKEIYMNVFEALEKGNIILEQGETDVRGVEWIIYEEALEKIMSYSKKELIKAREMFEDYFTAK